MYFRKIAYTIILVFYSQLFIAQNAIRNISIKIDTIEYNAKSNCIYIGGEKHLAFKYNSDELIALLKIYPNERISIQNLKLHQNTNIKLLDSLTNINNEYYAARIQMLDITKSSFPQIRLSMLIDSSVSKIEEFKLQPYTTTTLSLYGSDNELFIGEEKIFELSSNNPANLRFQSGWAVGADFDYRLQMAGSQIRLHLVPKTLGRKNFEIKLPVIKPDFHDNKLSFEPLVFATTFNVKSGRLAFLSTDKKEITFDDLSRRDGVEIQIDRNRGLQMHRTYRIEDQEAPGGALIAELFTRQSLNNDRILCRLRVYNLHRPLDGYLYIKDGDEAKFITNFGISPKTTITKISLLRNGVDWIESNVVNPGETLNLRIEGEGLQKARFMFEDIKDVVQDSVVRTDFVSEFRISIPLSISKKKIFIYNQGENTGKSLQVREFQEPRSFDFVAIDFGSGPKKVNDISGPELYNKTIKNIAISFDPEKIDQLEKLYGKQFFEVVVKITGSRGELIELTTLQQIAVCPGISSPRHAYYDLSDCQKSEIQLNSHIGQKTYDLSDWTKISMTFRHNKDRYQGQSNEKTVEVVLQRRIRFDIDVSFPSLLTKIVNEEGWQNGLGVSMATIAQFSFYEKDKIARLLPYKVGIGFLALNAFNFSTENTYRDLGIVILGSVYPTRKDTKFSFPLYMGGGYLLNKGRVFFVFGPGIRVSF